MLEEIEKPIVTVAVITYNSAETVLETLDSIAYQSYGTDKIELVISDDSSTDNTVNLIDDWLKTKMNSFYDVKLIANQINGGISRNCNAAWFSATSDWIKTIAGDDILDRDCISNNVSYVTSCNAKILVSKMSLFSVNEQGEKVFFDHYPTPFQRGVLSLEADKQFKIISLITGLNIAPSSFIHRSVLAEIGYADTNYPMIEDYPLWFKSTLKGYRIHFLDLVTVFYRVGDSASISSKSVINRVHIENRKKIDDCLVAKYTKNNVGLIRRAIYYKICFFIEKNVNRRSYISLSLYRLALVISPYWLRDKLSIYLRRGK